MKTLIFLLIASYLLFAGSAQAANPFDVVINEIAWMGTENSYNDEWIELYNNTDLSINLEGWILKAADGTPEINLAGTVPAKGFYLLERTDDNTVPGVTADQIYTGALSNNGENLELYDNFGNLIDSVNYSQGWFAGDNSTKQTMVRTSPQLPGSHPGSWGTSQTSGGTPKTENIIATESSFPKESQVKKSSQATPEEESPQQEEDIAYSSDIITNESPPSPTGQDTSVLFIASIIAIFSGILILVLKRKLKTA